MYKIKNCFLYLNIIIAITVFTACRSKNIAETKPDKDLTMFVTTDIHYLDENEIVNTQGYKLWVDATEPEFLKEYVLSMIDGSNINNNQVRITTFN